MTEFQRSSRRPICFRILVSLLFPLGLLAVRSPNPPENATPLFTPLQASEPARTKPADPEADAPPTARKIIECRRWQGKLVLDGKADEAAWKHADVVTEFAPYWLKRKARTKTRARLLWDDQYLYFHAEMEDHDLFADVKEHDGALWNNDVFELFFKPSDSGPGYYEFEVNAANAILDMYQPSRGSGGFLRWGKAHQFHLKTAVHLRGTLNVRTDVDEGWSVEGKIPWSDFHHTGGAPKANANWKGTLCRYDYSTRFKTPELSSTAPLSRPDYHYYEDYHQIKFVK